MPATGSGDAGGAAPAEPAEPVGGAAAAGSAWPAALGLLCAAHEGLADNVAAALAAQRAHELDPENGEYGVALDRLLRRIPEACAAALQVRGPWSAWEVGATAAAGLHPPVPCELHKQASKHPPCSWAQAGGAAGLAAHLAGEREAARPEFLRRRPKYYYYYEWMKKRIAEQAR